MNHLSELWVAVSHVFNDFSVGLGHRGDSFFGECYVEGKHVVTNLIAQELHEFGHVAAKGFKLSFVLNLNRIGVVVDFLWQ